MNKSSALLSAAFLLAACGGSPAPAASPAPARSAPLPSASAAISTSPAPSAAASASSVASAPSQPAEPIPEPPAHPVTFERPYKLGQRPTVHDPEIARDDEQEVAHWNEGGRTGAWHPQPRVVVDNVKVQGKVQAAAILREARKKGYWPIRRCYDAALPLNQELRGKLSLRFTLRANGTVASPALAGASTLGDRDALACLRKAFQGLELVKPRTGTAKVTLDIALHPGDAPMKALEEPPVLPGPGVIDLGVVQALIAAGAGATGQACYLQGLRRVPGAWGRLVLRADVTADGVITSAIETDSTFPDALTARCVADAVQSVRLPSPTGGDVRVIVPIRMGAAR